MTIESDLRECAPVVRRLGSPFTTVAAVVCDAADELARLRSALEKLDSYLDFSEPQQPCGCWPDPSGFNEAMAEAKAALDGKNE